MLYVFIILGALIHIGFKFKSAFSNPEFEWMLFIRKNLVGTILGIITGITCVLLKDDIFTMFGILINNFTAVLIGYSGDSLFKKLIKKTKMDLQAKLK